jgi:hypothetical protein
LPFFKFSPQEPVAAEGQLAVGVAGIGLIVVSIIALFAFIDEAIAAERFLADQTALTIVLTVP